MKSKIYAVYGASGYGREVMPILRANLAKANVAEKSIVFIDDNIDERECNGHAIVTYRDFLNHESEEKESVIAIADSRIRQQIAQKLEGDNVGILSVISDNSVVFDDVVMGEGAIVSPFVTLTSNIRIGRYFQANIYSYVAHDCVIGDYVTFAPGVKCNGNVHIHDHAYIGTGAIIRQGRQGAPLTIGAGAVIGMGAVVTKDVPAGVTVVGNPAKPMIKK